MGQGVRAGKTLEEAVDEAISKSLKEGVLKDLLKKKDRRCETWY